MKKLFGILLIVITLTFTLSLGAFAEEAPFPWAPASVELAE